MDVPDKFAEILIRLATNRLVSSLKKVPDLLANLRVMVVGSENLSPIIATSDDVIETSTDFDYSVFWTSGADAIAELAKSQGSQARPLLAVFNF